MNKLVRLFFVICLLVGCSSSPSDAELERAIVRDDVLIGKVYQIQNINRKNGYEQSGEYVVQFSAEMHILENPTEYLSRFAKTDQTGVGLLAILGLASDGLSRWGLVTASTLAAAKKGEVIPFTGSVSMIKSEQGWILRPE